jgi:uncharacterized protein with PIN domain
MTAPYLADGTVSRLARWLRLFGLDVEEAAGADSDLLRRARLSGRTILTRCRRLAHRDPARVLLIAGDDPREQLRQVLAGTAEGAPLTRCSLCNAPLEPAGAEDVKPRVPPFVFAHHDVFARCPSCGRIYWEGTHVDRIRRLLAETRVDRSDTSPHP